MNRILKALGALLAYPSAELVAALPEIGVLIDLEARLPREALADLVLLQEELGTADLLDAQERYVALFDRGRATSLHLFEHVHGDSRDRGPAMVDLKEVYARAGLQLAPGELPDYLPAVLEYLALRPFAEAQEMLGDCAHILRAVGEALRQRGSRYAAVPNALLLLIGDQPLAAEVPAVAPEPPLDDEWREEPVFFGPPGGKGCGAAAPGSAPIQFMPRRS
jgi:nitrate reductase molybdenum cofactor assembly chaperone NarJ/NarW